MTRAARLRFTAFARALSTWVILLSEPQSYRLVIADDHPLFRGALREAVTGVFDRAEVAEAGTFEEVSELLERGGAIST